MPINIVIGLVALLVALVSYSVGAWGAFRSKGAAARNVRWLWIGFVFDVLATAMMAISSGGLDLSASGLPHTVVALVAMFGMLAGAIIGQMAVARDDSGLKAAVARWVLAPWALWVFVFVWGMVVRGSARMGA